MGNCATNTGKPKESQLTLWNPSWIYGTSTWSYNKNVKE